MSFFASVKSSVRETYGGNSRRANLLLASLRVVVEKAFVIICWHLVSQKIVLLNEGITLAQI
jgi:hypothetical protein